MSREEVAKQTRQTLAVLGLASSVSIGLLAARVAAAGNIRYVFLAWNLLLAWLPLIFAWVVRHNLMRHRWLSWQVGVPIVLWLGFLPNSFYLITDLIHLHDSGEVTLLFDAVLMVSFIMNGLILGYSSLCLMHIELLKRLVRLHAHLIVGGVLLACSFAIYLGRYLRWNTWDIIINPFGILFDISDRFINPVTHVETFSTTVTFFLLLSSTYLVVWQFIRLLLSAKK